MRASGTDMVVSDIVKQKAVRARVQNLPRLRGLLAGVVADLGPLSPGATVELVEAITARARGGVDAVRDVDGYVIRAVQESPDDVRWSYDRLDLGAVAS